MEGMDDRDAAVARTLSVIEDHHPRIGVDIDDSTWLECDCGWDETATKVDWHEHLVHAVGVDLTAHSWLEPVLRELREKGLA